MAPIKKRINGDMPCEAGFLVLPECLDQSYESRTACFPLTVRLPRFDLSVHAHNLVAPYCESRAERDAAEARDARYAGDSEWGYAHGLRDPEDWADPPIATSAVVQQLRFVTEGAADDDDDLQNTLHHFGRDRADWWLRFADWIGVATSQDLIGLGRQRRSSAFSSVTLWIDDVKDDQEPGFSKLNLGDVRELCGEPLTKAQLERIMALTAERIKPPLAWLLVRDARSLVRFHQYRRAALDAGTATELALTEMLDKHARLSKDASLKERIAKTTMLGPLIRLAEELAPNTLPPQIGERVKKPRNAATHEADALSKTVAEQAISTAIKVVEAAFPLSGFGFPVTPRSQ